MSREQTLHPTNEVAFMTTALSMVDAGLDVTACLPCAGSLVRAFGLHMELLNEPVLWRKTLVYERAASTLSPAAQNFKEFLLVHVAARDYASQSRPAPFVRG